MKLDLAKTNGTSPPTDFPNQPRQQTTPQQCEQIWTVAEVADYLKMSPRQVLELTRRRSQERSEYPLPYFKIHSKCLRFRKSDVQQWLEVLSRKAGVQ